MFPSNKDFPLPLLGAIQEFNKQFNYLLEILNISSLSSYISLYPFLSQSLILIYVQLMKQKNLEVHHTVNSAHF